LVDFHFGHKSLKTIDMAKMKFKLKVMYNDIQKDMVFKFLKINYPVKRIKYNNKFKRTIVLDDGSVYYLSDDKSHKMLSIKLVQIIKYIFCMDEITARIIVNDFLGLK